jgi:hypothetical protein
MKRKSSPKKKKKEGNLKIKEQCNPQVLAVAPEPNKARENVSALLMPKVCQGELLGPATYYR